MMALDGMTTLVVGGEIVNVGAVEVAQTVAVPLV